MRGTCESCETRSTLRIVTITNPKRKHERKPREYPYYSVGLCVNKCMRKWIGDIPFRCFSNQYSVTHKVQNEKKAKILTIFLQVPARTKIAECDSQKILSRGYLIRKLKSYATCQSLSRLLKSFSTKPFASPLAPFIICA